MKAFWKFFVVLFTIFALSLGALAQDKVAVQVIANAEDTVGTQLAYLVKNETARGYQMRLTTDSTETRIVVVIHTIERGCGFGSQSTVFSVVWCVDIPEKMGQDRTVLYMDSTVGFCGTQVCNESAREIALRTNNYIDALREAIQDLKQQEEPPRPKVPQPQTPAPKQPFNKSYS